MHWGNGSLPYILVKVLVPNMHIKTVAPPVLWEYPGVQYAIQYWPFCLPWQLCMMPVPSRPTVEIEASQDPTCNRLLVSFILASDSSGQVIPVLAGTSCGRSLASLHVYSTGSPGSLWASHNAQQDCPTSTPAHEWVTFLPKVEGTTQAEGLTLGNGPMREP